MNDVIIKNGHLIDPANNVDQIADIHIVNGKVAAIEAANSLQTSDNIQTIDASKLTVIPGLVDCCARLREPGQENKATHCDYQKTRWVPQNFGNKILRYPLGSVFDIGAFKFVTPAAYVRNAGIRTDEKLMLHCLRKSWACNLAESWIPPQTLLKIGGWSDIETVQKFYLKNSDENEKKAVEALDRLVVRSS